MGGFGLGRSRCRFPLFEAEFPLFRHGRMSYPLTARLGAHAPDPYRYIPSLPPLKRATTLRALLSGGALAAPMTASALLAAAIPLLAQSGPSSYTAQAVRVEEPPVIDGVLGDAAWSRAEVIRDFVQREPFEGRPVSEHTEVRIIYDESAIYVGAWLYDRSPGAIVVGRTLRDAPLNDTDAFQIVFDTYLDRQNGFVFGTTPSGIEYDGQVSDEGGTGGGRGGRRPRRRRVRWTPTGRIGRGLQPELGRELGGRDDHRRRGVVRRVPHPLLDPPLHPRWPADVGGSTSRATSAGTTRRRCGRPCHASTR